MGFSLRWQKIGIEFTMNNIVSGIFSVAAKLKIFDRLKTHISICVFYNFLQILQFKANKVLKKKRLEQW